MAVDWLAIKNEYISTRISLRKLAEKYDVSFSTLGKKAVNEKWKEDRAATYNRVATKTKQKVVAAVATQEADRIMTLLSISDKLTEKISKAAANLGEVSIVKRKKTSVEVDEESGEEVKIEETQDVAVRGDAIVNSADVRNLTVALKSLHEMFSATQPPGQGKEDDGLIAALTQCGKEVFADGAEDVPEGADVSV